MILVLAIPGISIWDPLDTFCVPLGPAIGSSASSSYPYSNGFGVDSPSCRLDRVLGLLPTPAEPPSIVVLVGLEDGGVDTTGRAGLGLLSETCPGRGRSPSRLTTGGVVAELPGRLLGSDLRCLVFGAVVVFVTLAVGAGLDAADATERTGRLVTR